MCRSETGLDRKQHVQIAPETGKGLGVVFVSALSDAVERSVVVALKQHFSLKMTILSSFTHSHVVPNLCNVLSSNFLREYLVRYFQYSKKLNEDSDCQALI